MMQTKFSFNYSRAIAALIFATLSMCGWSTIRWMSLIAVTDGLPCFWVFC
jgi:hypothetical protein